MRIAIAPGVRLFVDIEGPSLVPAGPVMKDKPTLLLLHGGPGYDHSGFKPAFSRLADVAQLVYYDHRGHGRSDRRPPEEWTLDTFADDIVRLCEALGIDRPVVLGQSFGGFVAQRYLDRHPGHASKVILSSTSPHMKLSRKLAMFEKKGGARAREVAEAFWTRPGVQTWAEYQRVCKPFYNTRPAADAEASRRTIYNEPILFTSAAGEQQTMDLLPGLAKARCPVLVLAGREDPVCPLEDSLDIFGALPEEHRRLEIVEDAGHGTWRDQPEAAFTVLRRFLLEPA